MTLDPTTHRVYLSAATYEASAPAHTGTARRRPRAVPDSFRVLVYGMDDK
jgi:hypothetical protein